MEKQELNRISELTQISRERALTQAEQAERQLLRDKYIREFRSTMRAQLDSTVVQYPDGSRSSLRDAAKRGK